MPSTEPTCRYCGCTESRPCKVGGEPCFWVVPPGFRGKLGGVCSNPECLYRFHAQEPDEELDFAGRKFLETLTLNVHYPDEALDRLLRFLDLWHERRMEGDC
jgi:hypothetical protein